jgi:alanine racemase
VLSWVEVDAKAIRNNVVEFRRRLGAGPKLGAVVKSNAYGHGMIEVARIALDAGADWLCVNNVREGASLRSAGLAAPVLVMGYVPLDELADVVAAGLQPVVYNVETLDRLNALASASGNTVPVHMKVETGTHRQGVLERDVPAFVRRIAESPALTLAGVSTHFANIEDTTNHDFAESQIAAYARIAGTVATHYPSRSSATRPARPPCSCSTGPTSSWRGSGSHSTACGPPRRPTSPASSAGSRRWS